MKQKPALINVDAEKILLANKNDHKSLTEFIFQYEQAKNYVDRREAVDYAASQITEQNAISFLRTVLKDPNYRIRRKALNSLKQAILNEQQLFDVEIVAKTDANKLVKAEALSLLGMQNGQKYKELLVNNLNDSSYTVAGTVFSLLIDLDEEIAMSWLPKLKTDAKGILEIAVAKAEILTKTDKDFDEQYSKISKAELGEQYQNLPNFFIFLKQVNDIANFKKGLDLAIKIRDEVLPYVPAYKDEIVKELTKLKSSKENKKSQGLLTSQMDTQIQYIDSILKDK